MVAIEMIKSDIFLDFSLRLYVVDISRGGDSNRYPQHMTLRRTFVN